MKEFVQAVLFMVATHRQGLVPPLIYEQDLALHTAATGPQKCYKEVFVNKSLKYVDIHLMICYIR
jgi:hypothetical protein